MRHYSNGIQVIDVSDPAKPKFVSNWWLPGQREGEEEEYKKWREYGDRRSFTTLHGPTYVPRRIEDGGRYGYSAYSALGMMIHDFSDVRESEARRPLLSEGGVGRDPVPHHRRRAA